MPGQRKILIAIGIITVLLAVTNLGAWVRSLVGVVVRPFQEGLAPHAAPLSSEELTTLREDVIGLTNENVVLRNRLGEYQQIKGEGGIPPAQVVVVRGRIISRTQRAGRRYSVLDVGAIDGVTKGMPACSGWSLLGVVEGVQGGRCLVQEVGDAESRIPAAIVDPVKQQKLAEGVLAGSGAPWQQSLDYIEQQNGVEIQPGMLVVSAGADGRLPAGLVLGTVLTAIRGGAGDHWLITVQPVRTTDNLESLLVIRFAQAAPATTP